MIYKDIIVTWLANCVLEQFFHGNEYGWRQDRSTRVPFRRILPWRYAQDIWISHGRAQLSTGAGQVDWSCRRSRECFVIVHASDLKQYKLRCLLQQFIRNSPSNNWLACELRWATASIAPPLFAGRMFTSAIYYILHKFRLSPCCARDQETSQLKFIWNLKRRGTTIGGVEYRGNAGKNTGCKDLR